MLQTLSSSFPKNCSTLRDVYKRWTLAAMFMPYDPYPPDLSLSLTNGDLEKANLLAV